MRKSICYTAFLLIVLLMCKNKLNAQEKKYNFSLHFAPNISWMKPEVDKEIYTSNGSLLGFGYGGMISNNLSDNVSFGIGLSVFHTGGKLKYRDIKIINISGTDISDTGIVSRKYNLQYVEFPVVVTGNTGNVFGDFSIYGKFGLGTGFNIKAKTTDEFLSDNSSSGDTYITENTNAQSSVSFFRESLILGAGIAYSFSSNAKVFADLTFNNGFTDILTGSNTYTPSAKEKGLLNFVEINVGLMF